MRFRRVFIILLLSVSVFSAVYGQKQITVKGATQTDRQIPPKTGAVEISSQSEIDEAAAYLNEVRNNFLNLKIYQLAGTDKLTVSPEIAGSVLTTGENHSRFHSLANLVLKYHKLNDICNVVIFEDDQPRVFTYKLRSVSFSTGAVKLLNDDEIISLIAHEIGHVYSAKELANARDTEDARAARVNELKCDVIALLTLKNLGIDPNVLTAALKKLVEARLKMGLKTETAQSPALADREKLVEIFISKFNQEKIRAKSNR